MKFKIYKTNIFQIAIPLNWKSEINDFVHAFYDPDGNGSVQISSYTHPDKGKKINFIESLKKAAKIPNIKIVKRKNSAETNFIKDSKYWMMKTIVCNRTIAFITYNCQSDNIDQIELGRAKEIFDSFKFVYDNP